MEFQQHAQTARADTIEPPWQDVQPKATCDLIMKGGVASGVLYPPAILQIASKYRLHQIGGTSAGAIAAAAAAAAEYGRATADRPSPDGKAKGYRRLEEVQHILAQDKFVFHLFQPANRTEPLFDTILDIKEQMSRLLNRNLPAGTPVNPQPNLPQSWLTQARVYLRTITPILHQHTPAALRNGRASGILWGMFVALGFNLLLLLVAGIAFSIAWLLGSGLGWSNVLMTILLFTFVLSAIFGAVGWYIGGFVGSTFHLIDLAKVLTQRDVSAYGFCRGSKPRDAQGQLQPQSPELTAAPALTDWLTETLNELAGLPTDWLKHDSDRLAQMTPQEMNEVLLTFSHLKDKNVDIRLVTTNLSEGQPYVLPLAEHAQFDPIFAELDMLKLFPQGVVEYLKCIGGQQREAVKLPEGYYFLPEADKLPVVVATRMSLSFPILLCAVRMYTIKRSVYIRLKRNQGGEIADTDLQEHWFSDGGITSNFPIHMFDAWRPTHPTFGIKLYGWLAPTPDDVLQCRHENDDQHADPFAATIEQYGVYLPQPNETEHGGSPMWTPVTSVWRFLGNIFDTMQNFRDNTQSVLPGYRERIVQVYLKDNEGGLNLDMPETVVHGMIEKGRKAGEVFINASDPTDPHKMYFDFDQHQWVRFRVLMAQLEQEVSNLKNSLLVPDAAPPSTYERLIEAYCQLVDSQLRAYNEDRKWYRPMDDMECEQAKKRVQALWQFVQQWEKATDELREAYNAYPSDTRPRKPFSEEFFLHNAPTPPSVLRVTAEL